MLLPKVYVRVQVMHILCSKISFNWSMRTNLTG